MVNTNSGFCAPFITVLILGIIGLAINLLHLDSKNQLRDGIQKHPIVDCLVLAPYLYVIYQLCKRKLNSLAWWVVVSHVLSNMYAVFSVKQLIHHRA